MIIQLDAGTFRERDAWERPGRCVKAARNRNGALGLYRHLFRLDHRGKCWRKAGHQRAWFCGTREGIAGCANSCMPRLCARFGSGGRGAVIGDGAGVDLAFGRRPVQGRAAAFGFLPRGAHLALWDELVWRRPSQAQGWLRPLVRQLKNQSAIKVVEQLEEILTELPAGAAADAVQKRGQLLSRTPGPKWITGLDGDEANPSAAELLESTCRQRNVVSSGRAILEPQGDEALLCLETFWRNGRWHLLFPHNRHIDPSKN